VGLHGVTTKWFNAQVKRNRERFPKDFVFQLSRVEMEGEAMRSQIVTAYKRNVRYRPYAFTEHGAVMAANVLNSPSAVQMSVFVVRAFIKMRSLLTDRKGLSGQLVELEKKLTAHRVPRTGRVGGQRKRDTYF